MGPDTYTKVGTLVLQEIPNPGGIPIHTYTSTLITLAQTTDFSEQKMPNVMVYRPNDLIAETRVAAVTL